MMMVVLLCGVAAAVVAVFHFLVAQFDTASPKAAVIGVVDGVAVVAFIRIASVVDSNSNCCCCCWC